MGFSLFNKKTKEEIFWVWFTQNQKTYYNDVENLDIRDEIFNKLTENLNKVNPNLSFEFSPIHQNKIRELSISAEGIKDEFPSVIKLIEAAPKINNWQFNSFRQRVPDDYFEIQYGEIKIGYDDIFFRYADDNGKIGIELNIRDYNNETQNAIYILLDGLIGEYDVTMRIGWIDWKKLDENEIENLNPLITLRTLIDENKSE